MRAFWMDPTEVECDAGALAAEGITCTIFDPRRIDEVARAAATERSLGGGEQVQLDGETPHLETILAKEADEHAHLAAEIRLFAAGDGVYDVRARDERWVRIWVGPGDLVVIPAKRYHRFLLGQAGSIGYRALFADRSGLLPLFRQSGDATRAV